MNNGCKTSSRARQWGISVVTAMALMLGVLFAAGGANAVESAAAQHGGCPVNISASGLNQGAGLRVKCLPPCGPVIAGPVATAPTNARGLTGVWCGPPVISS